MAPGTQEKDEHESEDESGSSEDEHFPPENGKKRSYFLAQEEASPFPFSVGKCSIFNGSVDVRRSDSGRAPKLRRLSTS